MRCNRRLQILPLLSSVGGSVFALQGCDPTVRSTMLEGVQSAATTLATALILSWFTLNWSFALVN
jgi:hypothetical protein